jgi:uncharacterized phage-associated protein
VVTLRKIEAILAYFTNNTDTKYLGKVKLMKLFYFLDFDHVRKYGTPVTYDTYFNMEHGPVPSQVKDLVEQVADDPEKALLSNVIHCEFPEGTRMCRVLPNRAFTEKDRLQFTDTELEVMQAVAKRYQLANTDKVEADSHQEAPWAETSLLDRIPYQLAAHDKNAEVTEEEITMALL